MRKLLNALLICVLLSANPSISNIDSPIIPREKVNSVKTKLLLPLSTLLGAGFIIKYGDDFTCEMMNIKGSCLLGSMATLLALKTYTNFSLPLKERNTYSVGFGIYSLIFANHIWHCCGQS